MINKAPSTDLSEEDAFIRNHYELYERLMSLHVYDYGTEVL
jgi:hypothetical protein